MATNKTNERGRPICREVFCTVEITSHEKYCAAHEWVVSKWAQWSRRALRDAIPTILLAEKNKQYGH